MKTIYICTTNQNKLNEYERIFEKLYPNLFELKSIEGLGLIDVEEDEDSLPKNAIKKGREYRKQLIDKNISFDFVLAEDFGLALIDNPLVTECGVKSKRLFESEYFDLNGIDLSNYENDENGRNQYLIDYHKGSGCCYFSYISLLPKEGITYKQYLLTGITDGRIASESRGTNGFAFDKIFELPNGKTIAELTNDEKDIISSRADAFDNFYLGN